MTAQAVVNLANEALARSQRNLALEFGGMPFDAPAWLSPLVNIAGRIGLDIGGSLLHSKLGALGIGEDIFNLVEQEANREGVSFGVVTKPPKLPTFASLGAKNAA